MKPNVKYPEESQQFSPARTEIQTSSEMIYLFISLWVAEVPQVQTSKKEITHKIQKHFTLKTAHKVPEELIGCKATYGMLLISLQNFPRSSPHVRMRAKEQEGGKHARAGKEKTFLPQRSSEKLCQKTELPIREAGTRGMYQEHSSMTNQCNEGQVWS